MLTLKFDGLNAQQARALAECYDTLVVAGDTEALPALPVSDTPATTPAQSVVPTAPPPSYTHDQIAKAGAALIDAGKMPELLGLLAKFDTQAVTQLKQEHLGSFATELRKLGAQI